MNADPASLDNLKDIAEPGAVSWWPPAIGWWVLAGALLIVAVILGYRAWCRWKANAYRRAAVEEIRSTKSAADVSEILKRTALVAFPRADVASLSGSGWCNWLVETSEAELSGEVRSCLTTGLFREGETMASQTLADFAETWIKTHKSRLEDREGRSAS